jgi:hypothetical protein
VSNWGHGFLRGGSRNVVSLKKGEKFPMDIIGELKQKEGQAILEGLAMMAYNPSIGRVLEKGGVTKFTKIISKNINKLEKVKNQSEFDAFHNTIVNLIMESIKTNRGKDLSYGQAQKPLNVFLKVFIDWANLPTLDRATKLRRFLHVPLDSILMGAIKENFPNQYSYHVVQSYDLIRSDFRVKLEKGGEKEVEVDSILKKMINAANFSLERMTRKEMYYAWQSCLRSIYPEKPLLLDVLWSINRGI